MLVLGSSKYNQHVEITKSFVVSVIDLLWMLNENLAFLKK